MILISIVGTGYHEASKGIHLGQRLKLVAEPTNKYDTEAIKVLDESSENQIGYVANSCKTVSRGCYSAGRLGEIDRTTGYANVILMGDNIVAIVEEK